MDYLMSHLKATYGAPSNATEPGITGGKLMQRTAQPSTNEYEQPAQGQQETGDVSMKTAEHKALECAVETRCEPVLEQQAQDLEQRALDQTEDHLIKRNNRFQHRILYRTMKDRDRIGTQVWLDLWVTKVESHCLLQLKVSCSGGTVASSRGDNLRWKVPVDWYTSRKKPVEEHQSQGTLTLYHLSKMASSLISRSHHIDFDSIFCLDDAKIVQMFESLVTMGLMEFLGCPAIFHESALIEFFANGSVRDGMVVSTIGGIAVEIRESVFAETFGLPTEGLTDLSEGLTDLSEVPRNLLSDAQNFFSASEKEVSTSCLKKEIKMQYRLLSDILAKSLFVKAGSFDVVTRDRFLLMTAINFDVKVNWGNLLFGVLKEMVTPDSHQAKGYTIQICVLLKNIPGLELGESKAFPAPRILNEKTVHRIVSVNDNVGVEEVGEAPRAKKTPVKKTLSKKRQAASEAEVAPVIKKKRSTKGKPAVARRIYLDKQVEDTTRGTVDKVSHVPVQVAPLLDDVDIIIRQVISESTDLSSHKTDQGDKPVDETDTGDDFDAWLESSFPGFDSRVDEPVVASTNLEKATSSKQSAEVHLSLDDFLLQIPNDMLLPSITTAEISMLRLGESSSFRDKGKAILVEDDQLTENSANEIAALVCSDVDFLVRVRDSVMNVVVDFFASFSLNNMPDMEPLKDLKEKEKLMMEWAETTTLATAVRRQMYVLAKYREMILRTFVESYSRYLARDQPWNNMAVQVFSLLSAAHSQSLDDLKAQQLAHNFELVQPTSSPPVLDCTDCSGVRLSLFYSISKSMCWVRPVVLINGVWTPLQESGYWRSDCAMSLFIDRKKLPASVTAEYFDSEVPLIEPARYWGAAPLLVKFWAWQRVCTEAIQFSISGRLRPANFSSDIFIRNLGVERLPDYFLDDFEHGVNTGYFADFLSGSSGHSGSDFDSASSSGDTVYRSPSPPDYAYALGPPILSPTTQEEKLYFVQSPDSSPAASPPQKSSSSSSGASLHFDSEDLPVHDQEAAHTSAPVDSNVFTNALEDLRSYLSQRIDESTHEIRSKANDVEFNVRGDLLKQQSWLRQTFQDACDVLERQKNSKSTRGQTNALDGQVAALRNEQLEFQNRISADLLSLSTQFADIFEFIRSSDAKKGEGGSSSRPPPVRVERRPLPTPQSPRDVAVRIPTFPRTTGTFAERVEQARRHILESGQFISVEEAAERIRQADFQESDRLQRERERARREKRSSSSRRRRGF
ncbi:hypothetical protein F511_18997 [Dorcoceras hygrometricum]|uniref:Dystroglycan-like n=1 Tax=Dorcoceras hygrometricum TaxID=472368 RepID=A0A2Z7D840_9LAMI|nr:hypothetical protein F511_18997 [Dorcoceras hygrometricum]